MNQKISFPTNYKKALFSKKNKTIRFGDELGKYKEGEVYEAVSYNGADWGLKIEIENVISCLSDQLYQYEIPKKSIEKVKNDYIKTTGKKESFAVELIRFKLIK